jgi:hypothetical protein
MSDADTSIIETVREYQVDIAHTKDLLKVAREQKAEARSSHSAAAEVDRLSEELKAAKADLKTALLSDADWNNACEEESQLKAQLADQQDILSGYLLEHFRSTGEKQIELDTANHDGREVVIKAKLGAEIKIQTNLFGGASNGNEQ